MRVEGSDGGGDGGGGGQREGVVLVERRGDGGEGRWWSPNRRGLADIPHPRTWALGYNTLTLIPDPHRNQDLLGAQTRPDLFPSRYRCELRFSGSQKSGQLGDASVNLAQTLFRFVRFPAEIIDEYSPGGVHGQPGRTAQAEPVKGLLVR